MHNLWNNIIKPIIESVEANYIVEVGSDTGINTKYILEYCVNNNAHMTAIDPSPKFDIDEFKARYGDKFEIYTELSLSRLPLIKDYDVILIDGDHNWYTVYNELKIIEKNFENKKFPLVILHDVSWPYGRRDLYYNPENIPEIYRQPYKKLGIYPGQKDLKVTGGLNHHLYNSIYENNPNNGVLTAIEDFIEESKLRFSLEIINIFSGLGILFPKNNALEGIVKETIKSANLLDSLEKIRVKSEIANSEIKSQNNLLEKKLNESQRILKEKETQQTHTQNKLKETENKLSISNQEIQEKKTHLETIEKQLKQTEKQLATTTQENQQKQTHIQTIKKQLKQTEKQLATTTQENQQKQTHIQTIEKQQKEIKNQFESLNTQISDFAAHFYEMEYLNNNRRSLIQKLISKFPGLYILFHRENSSLKNALINVKGYWAIKKNNLVNIGYYLKNNDDVRISGMDPIIHYIYYGFKECRKPNPDFDSYYYLKTHNDVKNSNLNPLVHYSLYGMEEGRTVNSTIKHSVIGFQNFSENSNESMEEPEKLNKGLLSLESTLKILNYKNTDLILSNKNNIKSQQYTTHQIDEILNALDSNKKISIIIPIYNAFKYTKKCIDSVLKNTKIPYEMILIDDCSSDKRIEKLLDEMDKIDHVTVIKNQENMGFVKNINTGIENSEGDVVLLNSDTIVTPRWLSKLIIAAYSDERIGTVTPLTNASAISVPEIRKSSEIPENLTVEGMACLVERVSNNLNIETPTGNGFCMFIKRKTIEDVGNFDEKNFGMGYGEENDFCIRAGYKNWKNVYNDSIFIYHKRKASFSTKGESLSKENRVYLEKTYPNFINQWNQFVSSNELQNICNSIKHGLNNIETYKIYKKRVLYVTNQESIDENLMFNLQNTFEFFVLTSNANKLTLCKYENDNLSIIQSWDTKSNWSLNEFYDVEFRDIYFNVLMELRIDIVHLNHLINRIFDLIEISDKLMLPIILSLHDFYCICPLIASIDNDITCFENCALTYEDCKFTHESLNDGFNQTFSKKWKKEMSNALNKCSTILASSEIMQKALISTYPQLKNKNLLLIEEK